jgi:hypothetical protein
MRTRFMGVTIVMALALVGLPAMVGAELLPWDQAKVTELGRELATTMSAARQTALKEPTLKNATVGRLAAERFLSTMKHLETATRQLAKQLEAGQGREETEGKGRQIGSLLRDAQEDGRQLMITQTLLDKIEPVVDVINRMSPYYSDKSPLMPNPLNRSGQQPSPDEAK